MSFAERLRERDVRVGLTAVRDFVDGLAESAPTTRTALYWTARITLVRSRSDLAAFDEVFDAVFGEALLALDPHARRDGPIPRRGTEGERDAAPERRHATPPEAAPGSADRAPLPWTTLPSKDPDDRDLTVPHPLPTDLPALLDTPIEQLDPQEAALLAHLLDGTPWPTRRTRRFAPRPGGSRIALRHTLARSRRTGWEPVRLVRTGPVRRPRRVVAVCDVSRSMRAQAVAYLHLMGALARRADAEVFAFSTSLTRLTAVLGQRSAEAAVEAAAGRVTDRFGGTRIAHCLGTLLASHHGGALRGAVVLVCSDGWDGDPPEQLAAVMARLRRRAHLVVWLNPRASVPGFAPRTSTLAAALPYVDLHLPGGNFGDLLGVPGAIAEAGRARLARSARTRAGSM